VSNENQHAEGAGPEQPDSIDHLDFEPEAVQEEAPQDLSELEQAQAEAASHLEDLQRLNAEY
jgi:molecular chaperone GrpE